MSSPRAKVTHLPRDTSRIPDALSEGTLCVHELCERGHFDAIAEVLHIRRQGGFSAFDVWLWLMLYFCAGTRSSIKDFWCDTLMFVQAQVAAVAGRCKLPTPASLSRALSSAEHDLVRDAVPTLLCKSTGVDELIGHEAMATRDACGRPWHIFDIDPTSTVLRHRALPLGEDLPEPLRLAERCAEAGYTGRKRGELLFRRVTVQHAASGAWVHAHLSPGNGASHDLDLALDAVVAAAERASMDAGHVIVRLDGEYGHVPGLTACRERGLCPIVRLNRSHLLDDPQVLERLRKARFYHVSDSGSGPVRSACDLGLIELKASSGTTRVDGEEYEPITVRVVASMMERTTKSGAGRVVDGYQVELFATFLSASSWPCEEVVTSYYGRNAEENRFAQEDRELGLDRVLSYNLPGQELCTAIGLSVWNLRLVRGFAMSPESLREAARQRSAKGERVIDESIPREWPRSGEHRAALAMVDWETLLSGRQGWRFDAEHAELLCEDGRAMQLTSVRLESGRTRGGLIFRRLRGGCEECEFRERCLRSDREHASKHIELYVDAPVCEILMHELAVARGKHHKESKLGPIQTPEEYRGSHAIHHPLLLPAEARKLYRESLIGVSLRIELDACAPAPPGPRLLASSRAQVQRRRAKWSEQVARNELPDGSEVAMAVYGQVPDREAA